MWLWLTRIGIGEGFLFFFPSIFVNYKKVELPKRKEKKETIKGRELRKVSDGWPVPLILIWEGRRNSMDNGPFIHPLIIYSPTHYLLEHFRSLIKFI